ncbi:MAG: type IV pili methyl-accepting chemotaxis transducer N-terminal domain-containing protein [Pseudomonadota bacterium]
MWKHMGVALRALAIGLTVALSPGTGAAQTPAPLGLGTISQSSNQRVQDQDGGFVEDIGAGERVDYAGRLRMLSQRVAAMMCYNFAGISGVDAKSALKVTAFEIDLILDALEFGNPDLGIIGAETNSRVLSRLADMRDVWEPMKQNIDITIDFGFDWSVAYIYLQSIPLLEAAVLVVVDIAGAYSDPAALLQEDSMRIDIAGRQRMLAQRISKAYCLTRSDIQAQRARAELDAAAELWGVSAQALRFGMPDAGVNQTDDPGILAALDDILEDWAALSERIRTLEDDGGLNDVEIARFITAIDMLTVRMNKIVGMFAVASKQDL